MRRRKVGIWNQEVEKDSGVFVIGLCIRVI